MIQETLILSPEAAPEPSAVEAAEEAGALEVSAAVELVLPSLPIFSCMMVKNILEPLIVLVPLTVMSIVIQLKVITMILQDEIQPEVLMQVPEDLL